MCCEIEERTQQIFRHKLPGDRELERLSYTHSVDSMIRKRKVVESVSGISAHVERNKERYIPEPQADSHPEGVAYRSEDDGAGDGQSNKDEAGGKACTGRTKRRDASASGSIRYFGLLFSIQQGRRLVGKERGVPRTYSMNF